VSEGRIEQNQTGDCTRGDLGEDNGLCIIGRTSLLVGLPTGQDVGVSGQTESSYPGTRITRSRKNGDPDQV
jgi:hypothetical protein